MVQLLEGQFSIVLLDNTIFDEKVIVIRDPLGIYSIEWTTCSESYHIANHFLQSNQSITHSFLQGSYTVFRLSKGIHPRWEYAYQTKYYSIPFSLSPIHHTIEYRIIDKYVKRFQEQTLGIIIEEDLFVHFDVSDSELFVISMNSEQNYPGTRIDKKYRY
jgi:hypothetical protein